MPTAWATSARVARPLSLIAATAVLLWPGLSLGPSLDSAVFVLAGSRIRDGFMPYRDLWDHKPPGVFVINALGQIALPWLNPWLVSWLLTLAFSALAILILDVLLHRRLSAVASWCWSLVSCVGVGCYLVAMGGGLTESFALLPLMAALWVIDTLPPTRSRATAVGLALGCACVISLQSLPACAVIGVAAAWRDDGWFSVKRMAAVVGGGTVAPLAVAGWLLLGGAGADAIDQLLTYNAAYGRLGNDLLVTAMPTVSPLVFLAIPFAVGAGRLLGGRPSRSKVEWVCLAWCLTYVAWIVYQGRIFPHYMILIVPPLVLLGAGGMDALWARARSPGRQFRGAAIALSAAVLSAFAVSATLTIGLSGLKLDQVGVASNLGNGADEWIRANTPASATTFVWGDDAQLYLGDNRPEYDRYVYQYPLVTPGYWSAQRTAELLDTWRVSPPGIIVETQGTVPMFRPSPSPDARDLDTLGPLRDFVRGNYRLMASFDSGNDFADVYVYFASS